MNNNKINYKTLIIISLFVFLFLLIFSIVLILFSRSNGIKIMYAVKVESNRQSLEMRELIESEYEEFTLDYEYDGCFAGCMVEEYVLENEHYFIYIVSGSGVKFAKATCFKVDSMMRVYKVGEFPDYTDSFNDYSSINPINCKGVK